MHIFSFAPGWFLQGLLHPLQTPAHILLILGLGLLVGQQQRQLGSLLIFSLSIILGLILNQNLDQNLVFNDLNLNIELMLLALGLVTSLLVIIKIPLPSLLVWFFVLISGLVLGFDSSPMLIPGLGATSIYNWLAGAASSFIGIILITTIVAYFASKLWQGIILRVLASWIATSAIFVLTFILLKI